MTERPNVVFGWLVAAAALAGVLIASGLAALGLIGVVSIAATLAGALTACVFFLVELDRVPPASLVLVALALGSAAAFTRTVLLYLRQRRLLRALPLEPVVEGRLADVARAAGVSRLYRTPARQPSAFCFGLLRPGVVVTSGLLQRLDDDEQEAVLWHEASHARAREPLKALLGRLATSSFFWVPVLSDLFDRFSLAKELAADRVAVGRTSRQALAGALYEVAAHPVSSAAIGAGDLAGARIDRLLEPDVSLPPLFRRSRLVWSTLAVVSLGLVLAFPSRLDLTQTDQLRSMLTAGSVHGLPGMAAGLAVNAVVLGCLALFARRVLRERPPRSTGP